MDMKIPKLQVQILTPMTGKAPTTLMTEISQIHHLNNMKVMSLPDNEIQSRTRLAQPKYHCGLM